jgi:uncharacterized protein
LTSEVKYQKPVGEGLFRMPQTVEEKPQLIGSKCCDCGEVVFPKKTLCPNCCGNHIEEILISPRGRLYSFTVIHQAGPLGYKGPVPYGVVKVEMPEGLRITGYCTENDAASFRPGMEMEIIVEKLFEENNIEYNGFKFKPV